MDQFSPEAGIPGDLILSQNVTSGVSSVDFTTGITEEYEAYLLVAAGVQVASATALELRTSTDGGSTWDSGASDYKYAYQSHDSGNNNNTAGGTLGGVYLMPYGVGATAGDGGSALVLMAHPTNSSVKTQFFVDASYHNTDLHNDVISGQRAAAEANNALRVVGTAANITAGRFSLYGLKHE